MKKLIIIALGVVLVIVVAVVALLLSLDAGVKKAVEGGGSYALKVPVTLEKASVSITGGKASLRGLTIKNPEGFNTARAVHLGEAAVEIKLGSVTSEVKDLTMSFLCSRATMGSKVSGCTRCSSPSRCVKALRFGRS